MIESILAAIRHDSHAESCRAEISPITVNEVHAKNKIDSVTCWATVVDAQLYTVLSLCLWCHLQQRQSQKSLQQLNCSCLAAPFSNTLSTLVPSTCGRGGVSGKLSKISFNGSEI
jgi:hypothetical protein